MVVFFDGASITFIEVRLLIFLVIVGLKGGCLSTCWNRAEFIA